MTFYNEQVIKIKAEVYPKDYLCKQVVLAKQFIDLNYPESITIDDMACKACFSKFHFIRLFKKIYGKTPHHYLTLVRIEKAKELLQRDTTIAEACFSVGFESISSFKGLFKRYTNTTPASFRQIRQASLPAPLKFLPFYFSLQKSNFQD